MWTAQALRAALPALNIAAQPRHQGGQRHLLRHPRRWRPPRPRRPQSQFKMMVRTTGLEHVLSYEKQIFAPRRLSPPPFGVRGLDCPFAMEIGRQSCRERVCQHVYTSVVAVSLKKKEI